MSANPNNNFIPVTKWNEYHSWPTVNGLRYYISNSYRNGFDKVVKRIGRRVLIDENQFFEWINGGNA